MTCHDKRQNEVTLLGNGEYGTHDVCCGNCGDAFDSSEAENYSKAITNPDTELTCPYCQEPSGLTVATNTPDFFHWAQIRKEGTDTVTVSLSITDPRGSDMTIGIRKTEEGLAVHLSEGLEFTPLKENEHRGSSGRVIRYRRR